MQQSLAIPGAIVIAAALIAGAIYFGGSDSATQEQRTQVDETQEIDVAPVTAKDHIRGNPNAEIMLIEYSDYDCPFCSQFHQTMQKVIDEYGTSGNVAWVYRHFPIQQLHPNAPEIAQASECVAQLGGNDAFWTFTDLIFSEKPIETRNGEQYIGLTQMERLPEFAEQAGVDTDAFAACRESGRYEDDIAADVAAAKAAGGTGTPYTVIVAGNEVLTTIPGAFPYEDFKARDGSTQPGVRNIIKELIQQVPNNTAPVAD